MESFGRQHNKKTALIIEDDLSWEPLWGQILKSIDEHFEIKWATSAKEAEKFINEQIALGHMFDLIVADIFISGSKTGLDLIEKYSYQLKNRILVVSAVDAVRLIEKIGPLFQSISFLRKPFSMVEGVRAVKSILEKGHRQQNQTIPEMDVELV